MLTLLAGCLTLDYRMTNFKYLNFQVPNMRAAYLSEVTEKEVCIHNIIKEVSSDDEERLWRWWWWLRWGPSKIKLIKDKGKRLAKSEFELKGLYERRKSQKTDENMPSLYVNGPPVTTHTDFLNKHQTQLQTKFRPWPLQQIQIIKNWDQCFSCLYCISRYYKCNFDNVKSLRIAFGLDFSKFYCRSKLKALLIWTVCASLEYR